MHGPLVSVLMANHNYGRFIGRSVDSVAAQTYGPIELIIVDDGSTDDSEREIERLAQQHQARFEAIKTIRNPVNEGFSAALNAGIRHVEGAVTVILDSDDMLKPEYVERTLSELARSNPTRLLGFAYSDSVLVDPDDSEIGRGCSSAFDRELLQTMSYIPGCAATLTKALKEITPFDTTVQQGEKHIRWKRLAANGYAGQYIPEQLFFYRMHGSNASGIGRKVLDAVKRDGPTPRLLSGYWKSHPAHD